MKLRLLISTILSLVLALGVMIFPAYAKKPYAASLDNCISRQEIITAQDVWGQAIVTIGEAYLNGEDYEKLAAETLDQLYDYDQGVVLFKPTKASEDQFRLTEEEAISYFVGGVVAEDLGFALKPWSKVRFEDIGIILHCDSAVAMGNYYFTDANTGEETQAEFTFGYRRDRNGNLVIELHHSSLPYSPTS